MEESSRRECARDAIAPKPRRPNGQPATASAGEGIHSPPTDLRLKGQPLLRFGRWCPSYSLLKCGPLPKAASEEPLRKGRYWLRRSGASRRPDSVCTPSRVARQLAASACRRKQREERMPSEHHAADPESHGCTLAAQSMSSSIGSPLSSSSSENMKSFW